MQIHINSQGQEQGPFTIEEINRSLQQGAWPTDSTLAWYDGIPDWIPLNKVPGVVIFPPPLRTPPPPPVMTPPPPPAQGDATGGIIPYKNPHALTAYYLGIFGLFPAIGFFLAIPAVILGISGLKKHKKNPIIKGSIHAWIGIILGGISIGYHALVVLFVILGSR